MKITKSKGEKGLLVQNVWCLWMMELLSFSWHLSQLRFWLWVLGRSSFSPVHKSNALPTNIIMLMFQSNDNRADYLNLDHTKETYSSSLEQLPGLLFGKILNTVNILLAVWVDVQFKVWYWMLSVTPTFTFHLCSVLYDSFINSLRHEH